jgi:hypothetical protein
VVAENAVDAKRNDKPSVFKTFLVIRNQTQKQDLKNLNNL